MTDCLRFMPRSRWQDQPVPGFKHHFVGFEFPSRNGIPPVMAKPRSSIDRRSVSLDIEVDGRMSLSAAHIVATRFETAIRDELGPSTEVETHIEPLVVAEQMLYEVHDPANYLTPDVVVDFTTAQLEQVGPDRVEVKGARGRPPTDQAKASLTYADGFRAMSLFMIGGIDAGAKGQRVGAAMLAVAVNDIGWKYAATGGKGTAVLGIDTDRIISLTFVIGAVLSLLFGFLTLTMVSNQVATGLALIASDGKPITVGSTELLTELPATLIITSPSSAPMAPRGATCQLRSPALAAVNAAWAAASGSNDVPVGSTNFGVQYGATVRRPLSNHA